MVDLIRAHGQLSDGDGFKDMYIDKNRIVALIPASKGDKAVDIFLDRGPTVRVLGDLDGVFKRILCGNTL